MPTSLKLLRCPVKSIISDQLNVALPQGQPMVRRIELLYSAAKEKYLLPSYEFEDDGAFQLKDDHENPP